MRTPLDLLGRFGERLSLGARRDLARVDMRSPVPLARRTQSWSVAGQGRAAFLAQMDIYGTDAVVYPIVERLFTSVGEARWQLFTKAASAEDRTLVSSHAVLDLLERPNKFMSGAELVEAGQQHNELTGETNIVVGTVPGVKYPVDLWPIRPDRIEPVPDPYDFLKGWIYRGPDGDRVPLETRELLRHKRPSPLDPYRGMGPIQALMLELDGQRYGKEWQAAFFQNSARPGGIIEVDKRLDDDEFDEMKARWNEQHRGVSKAHRVAIVENGAKWIETAFSMRDLQMVESDAAARDKVLVAFGFPKSMLGITEDVNRANAEAGEYVFARWLVQPRLKKWRAMWNTQLLPWYGDQMARRYELDFVSPIPDNSEAANDELDVKSRALTLMVGAGFDSAEVLELLDWPDIPYSAPQPVAPVAPVVPDQESVTDGWAARSLDMAMRWKVIAEDDENSCKPCRSNAGRLYRNRASAYADYPGGSGYIKCKGRANCRCRVEKRRSK